MTHQIHHPLTSDRQAAILSFTFKITFAKNVSFIRIVSLRFTAFLLRYILFVFVTKISGLGS